MRMSVVGFFMILTTVFLSGCGQDNSASVENHGTSYYGRGGVVAMNSSSQTQQAVPVMSISSNDLGPASSSSSPASAPSSHSMSTAQSGGCYNGSPFAHAGPTSPAACSTQAQAAPAASATTQTAQASPVSADGWQWPVRGKITEKFGAQASGVSNEGIVIAANAGTPIRAAQTGEVAYVGTDTKTYGNIVILRHADGEMTSYAHAQSIIVKKGDKVPGGTVIGYVGQSGTAKVPELHFAVRDGKSSIDPLTKLPAQPQQMALN